MKTIKLISRIELIATMMLMSCTSGVSMQTVSSNEPTLSNELTLSNEKTQSNEVIIGKQVWMTVNLNIDKFKNGEVIPEAKTAGEWKAYRDAGEAAWCYYDYDSKKYEKYGKLYNWYAVNDPRGLAPMGWHVPTDEEWTLLTDYLGGVEKAGAKLKSKNGWFDDGNGTNSSGFSGLPGGACDHVGLFFDFGKSGQWWSSTENYHAPWYRGLFCHDNIVFSDGSSKEFGRSIRCIRD